jgi:pyridoxal phosphate enzyme (YggS family)
MPNDHTNIERKIISVKDSISRAAQKCGRDPGAIRLVAACKKVPEQKIRTAVRAGVTLLGESYIQEAKDKIHALPGIQAKWHFIGHLQTNKAKTAVALFDLIHTVDSLRLALALNDAASKINKIQNILVQVNIAGEKTKSGVDPQNLLRLIENIAQLDHVAVKGLMTLPPYSDNAEYARPYFKSLYMLSRRTAAAAVPGVQMDELSMGMSQDYLIAVEEGATLVRIGTFIFGERK